MSATLSTPPDAFAGRFEDSVRSHIRRLTQAPLRMRGRFPFESAPEDVFPYLTEPQLIAGWFGMIRGGSADHSQSSNVGTWGDGSTRTLQTWGMGDLYESVHHYDPPLGSVYSARSPMSPIINHAGLLLLDPTPSGCVLEWSQFFDFRGLVLKHIFPSMMVAMMNRGLRELQKRLGGEGGCMEMVR